MVKIKGYRNNSDDEWIETEKIIKIRHDSKRRQYRVTWGYEATDLIVYETKGMRALEAALGLEEHAAGGEVRVAVEEE